jgi:type IV secretory pathway VirB3-like protein
MKQQVLKAIANPARIFYVPYNLAILNFVAQFLVFMVIFVIDLSINTINANSNLMIVFLVSVCLVHFVLMFYSKKEPQLMQIILSKLRLFAKFIPDSLRV